MSRTLAIVIVVLALAVVAVSLIWHFWSYLKREARRRSITNLIERGKRGNKRALLRIYREQAFSEDEAIEFGLGEQYKSLYAQVSEEIFSLHDSSVNEWIARNIENPAFEDFANQADYSKLPRGAIRRRFTSALRTRDFVELSICAAYYDRWTYDVRNEVGDVLWAEVAKMLDELTAERESLRAVRQADHVSV